MPSTKITPEGPTETVRVPGKAKALLAGLAEQYGISFVGLTKGDWRAGLQAVFQGYFRLTPTEKLRKPQQKEAPQKQSHRGAPPDSEENIIDRI